MSAVVLTSENSADFYAGKLGLSPPEPAAAPAPANDAAKAGEPAVESGAKDPKAASAEAVTDGEQDSQHPDPEKRQKLNMRFSTLARERDEAKAKAEKAEADAKAARDARELAERQAAELRAKYEPPKPDELGPKPQRAQFANDDEFGKALEDWAGEKALRERDHKEAQQRIERQWTERQTAIKADLPDYDAVLAAGANLMVSNEVRDAILESEAGPGILYHLAGNPEVVERLKTLSRTAALRLIGKLEATEPWKTKATAAPSKEGEKPAAAAAEISRAPAPISPLKTATTEQPAPVTAAGEYVGDYATWKRLRKEGKIK